MLLLRRKVKTNCLPEWCSQITISCSQSINRIDIVSTGVYSGAEFMEENGWQQQRLEAEDIIFDTGRTGSLKLEDRIIVRII